MMDTFIDLLGRPRGSLASLLLGLMNIGHGPFVRSVLAEIHPEPSCVALDIGCGGGNAIALLAPRVEKIYGVDISPASVRKTEAKNRKHVASGKLSVSQADAASLPFEDETFDLITAFKTVYFWEDLERCFAAILKKLRPGGLFLVACEAARNEDGELNSFEKASKGKMRVYSRQELRSIFERSGFVSVSEYCRHKPAWLCMGGRRDAARQRISNRDGT